MLGISRPESVVIASPRLHSSWSASNLHSLATYCFNSRSLQWQFPEKDSVHLLAERFHQNSSCLAPLLILINDWVQGLKPPFSKGVALAVQQDGISLYSNSATIFLLRAGFTLTVPGALWAIRFCVLRLSEVTMSRRNFVACMPNKLIIYPYAINIGLEVSIRQQRSS